jgi:hypothetical protein
MARRILAVFIFLPLLLTGCIPIPYVYPTMDFVPPTQVGVPHDEVRAFRVDVRKEWGPCFAFQASRIALAEVPCSATGRTSSQVQVSMGYGYLLPYGVLNYQFGTHPDLELRLYRPGCQTVRVDSWQRLEQVDWQQAATLQEQERAIDQLLFACDSRRALAPPSESDGNVMSDWDGTPAALLPGSASRAHREALLFAGTEYERLAGLTSEESERVQLNLKAQRLRKLANE